MDEKEKELELKNGAQAEENTAPANGETVPEESDEWQFEASAPTLEGNLDVGGGYEIEIPDEEDEEDEEENEELPEEDPTDYIEIPQEGGESGEYYHEPLDDEEDEKAKRNFLVNKKAVKIAVIVAICACVAAVAAFFCVRFITFPNSNETMTSGNLALTVGDQNISVGYYNYYYNKTVEAYLEDAASGYLDLKAGVDYSTQITTDDDGNEITWEQKFRDETIWQIQYITAYYEAALKAGVTLTDEQKETIDTNIKTIQSNAAEEGLSVNEYLNDTVGEYIGINTMKTVFERLLIAQSYFYQTNVALAANDDEIQASFEENQENYKSITFAYIEMPYTAEDDVKAVKAKADAYCKEIKSLADMKNIIPEVCGSLIEQYIAYDYAADEKEAANAIANSMQYTFTKDRFKQWFAADEISDWMYSSDTAVGSVAAFVDEDYSCIDILYKLSDFAFDETELYSVRHILIMPHSEAETDAEDGTAVTEHTEEEWAAALEEANRILDEYNATDKTEVDFAELAEKYSEDTYSTSAGGYGYYGGQIFNTELGTMVPEFEGWSIDKSRQYGDVEIVKSKYGYHIMYFVYDGPSYMFSAKADADNLKQEEFVDSCPVTEHSALSKTTVASADSAE